MIAKVIVDISLDREFDYAVPPAKASILKVLRKNGGKLTLEQPLKSPTQERWDRMPQRKLSF